MTYQRDYTPEDAATFTTALQALSEPCKKASAALYTKMADGTTEYSRLCRRNFRESECLDGLEFVRKLSPDMGRVLDKMEDYGLYNIDLSSDKSVGGFTTQLSENADHFLYDCTSNGSFYNFITMWHEFGHYYYGTTTQEKYGQIGWGSEDLSEIESTGLELLGCHYIPDLEWPSLQRKGLLDEIISQDVGTELVTGAVTAFEHYCYTTSDILSADSLDVKWESLKTDYGLPSSYPGFTYIPHFYTVPCYYISYGTSTIPAFEIMMKAEKEGIDKGFAVYSDLVAATNNGGFKATLKKIGLSDPFSSNIISEIGSFLTSTYYS